MSDRKKASSDRRDERNVKDPNEVPKPKATKKDTKKWCKGKPGFKHNLVCRDYMEVKRSMIGTTYMDRIFRNWRILLCTECGKEVDYYSPMDFPNKSLKEPPPWVK